MKKLFHLFIALLFGAGVFAQSPQAFKYQAVVRDLSGNVLVNRSVSFKISILSGSVTGTTIYSETHTGKITNAFGLVDLEIGNGTILSGTFSSIPWGSNIYFVKVEMDPAGGSAYTTLGTSQLLSVPYALYAKDVQNNNDADADPANELQKITLSGTVLTLDKSGGSVTLPISGGGDNWGTQAVVTDITLAGNGTTANTLKIADNGVTSAKIADNSIQAADLTDNAVTSAKIAAGAVTTDRLAATAVTMDKIASGAVIADKLAASAITTEKINAGAVTGPKIAQAGATSGQTLKWNGTTWSPADDATGGGGTVPSGSSGHVQFNFKGNFGSDANFFWDNDSKRLGLGTSSPGGLLDLNTNSNMSYPNLLLTENDKDFARLMFKNVQNPDKNWTIASYLDLMDGNSKMNFWYSNGTGGANIMSITGDGKVGIGTETPKATLDVNGSAKIGATGVVISEIREITGTLSGPSYIGETEFSYPSGYTKDNTRVLSCEVLHSDLWYVGNYYYEGTGWTRYFLSYIDDAVIVIGFSEDLRNSPFRMLIMKVQ